MHGTDHPLAAVQTRHGSNCNYRRYSAFVPPLSQSSSPFHSRTQTPACHETRTPHYTRIHPGRRGCMLTHSDRHLPCIQRPHTRCFSHTWPLTHSPCLTHTRHTTHTRGGTHPRCLTHTGGFAHVCRFFRTRSLFCLRCPFHTRPAGKHALRHTRDYTTRTRGRFHTRGLTHTRGFFHTRGLTHTFHHTHRDAHAGDSRHL